MDERLGQRILIVLGIIILSIWAGREVWVLLSQFGGVLALFFCAWLVSFVLSPPTNALVRLGVRRPLAVIAVYVLVLAGLVLAVVLLAPLITVQLGQLLNAVNSYTAQTPGLLTWAEGQAREMGASDAEVRDFYSSLVEQARNVTGLVLQNMLFWVTGVASLVVNIIFCLIVSVYLMLDGRRILASALLLLPMRYRGEARGVIQTIGDNFGGFIRGQIILSLVYALAVAVVMWVTRLDYITICAVFAGIAMIIPFVGPFVSIVPPIAVVVLTDPVNAWWVILVLIIVQQTVLNAVGPRVFGHTVQMHPLLVIAAALSGATAAGFWGALFGIPAVGILASVARRYVSLRQQKETAPGPDDEAPAVAEAPAPTPGIALERPAVSRRGPDQY